MTFSYENVLSARCVGAKRERTRITHDSRRKTFEKNMNCYVVLSCARFLNSPSVYILFCQQVASSDMRQVQSTRLALFSSSGLQERKETHKFEKKSEHEWTEWSNNEYLASSSKHVGFIIRGEIIYTNIYAVLIFFITAARKIELNEMLLCITSHAGTNIRRR